MRYLILTMCLVSIISVAFGQDKSENAFIKAITEGYSTAPDFVVLTIRNLNNNETKELMTSVPSVYYAFEKELKTKKSSKIREFLLNSSSTRIFELSDKEALERLNFKDYQLKSAEKIEKIIVKNHIIDSLYKFQLYRGIGIPLNYHNYSKQRNKIAEEIRDSIEITRNLTEEENKILRDLKDMYYEWHYTEYAIPSKNGQELMKIWNSKIKLDKEEYQKYKDEEQRLEKKFIRDYYEKFGISFLHIMFKYGAIFYTNCINGMLEFNQIVE